VRKTHNHRKSAMRSLWGSSSLTEVTGVLGQRPPTLFAQSSSMRRQTSCPIVMLNSLQDVQIHVIANVALDLDTRLSTIRDL